MVLYIFIPLFTEYHSRFKSAELMFQTKLYECTAEIAVL